MKRLCLCFLLMCWTYLAVGQVTNEGNPMSWSHEEVLAKSSIAPVIMKPFDLDKIKAEDAINDLDRSIPWRFGFEYQVDLGLNNSGIWNDLPDGGRIWRINIISKGAKTLNFIFDTYKIPRGATIYLYNDDRSDLLGAYTNIFNRPDEMLGTWLVEGENIWIEYYEPASVKEQGKLNIAKVVHGYRSITDTEIRQKALGSSGDCNLDVDCTVGNDFDGVKERLKHAAAFVIMQGSVCSGTLINNTNNDKAPYFLTANHCNAGNEGAWAFRFNWISPVPSCATTSDSPDATVNQTTSGATLRAANPNSDVKLLHLDGGLDESWDLEWAGWDRTGEDPAFTIGIHHPSGDIMKVCRDNDPATKVTTVVTGVSNNEPIETWQVEDWDLGVTERGSSGSALFSPEGRIIGQLAGGGAACSGVDDNDLPDFYGRFGVSWDFGATDDTRLSNWLDPENTGRETLDFLSQETDGGVIIPPVVEDEIVVYNDSPSVLKIANEANKILDYIVFDVAGKEIASGRLTRDDESIDFSNSSAGVYFIYVINTSDGNSFTKKVIMNKGF